MLVNLSIQEIHLWDIEERKLIKKYIGQKQGRFVIRSTFAGVNENFVISGSEGKALYVIIKIHKCIFGIVIMGY